MPQSVAAAFEQADSVFLGKIVSVSSSPTMYSTGNAGWSRGIENATLVIEKAWKNARVGDNVRFRSLDIALTTCHRSLNEEPVDASKTASGRWIIYANGGQPYRLTICERSHPLTMPASLSDEEALDAMVRKK
jgi:hypothetical protein